MHLVLEDLAHMTLSYCNNTVFKYRWPEIAYMKDLLCSSITGHVTATRATVTIIQSFLGFLEGQTSSEYGIDPNTIKSISNYTIRLLQMADSSAGILRQLRYER